MRSAAILSLVLLHVALAACERSEGPGETATPLAVTGIVRPSSAARSGDAMLVEGRAGSWSGRTFAPRSDRAVEMVRIDLQSGRTTHHVLPDAPWSQAISADLMLVRRADDRLVLRSVDGQDRPLALSAGRSPRVALSADGSRLAIAEPMILDSGGAATLAVIDPAAARVVFSTDLPADWRPFATSDGELYAFPYGEELDTSGLLLHASGEPLAAPRAIPIEPPANPISVIGKANGDLVYTFGTESGDFFRSRRVWHRGREIPLPRPMFVARGRGVWGDWLWYEDGGGITLVDLRSGSSSRLRPREARLDNTRLGCSADPMPPESGAVVRFGNAFYWLDLAADPPKLESLTPEP